MEIGRLRELSSEQLRTELAKVEEQVFRIRFQKSLGNQEGLRQLKSLKLDIARMKTLLVEQTSSGKRQTRTGQAEEAGVSK